MNEVTQDYAKRCRPGLTLSFDQIAPGKASLSSAERQRDEAGRLGKRAREHPFVVTLDERGETLTSQTLARRLDGLRHEYRQIAVLIGGADGFEDGFTATHNASWSLSAMTLPHLIVQVVLAEQLYRAWTIIHGHPYHRD